jgi:hypothetical protein
VIETEKVAQISWDQKKFKRFKKAHSKAEKAGEDSFEFDGNEFYTRYAMYLIQYLEKALPKPGKKKSKVTQRYKGPTASE